MGDFFQFLIHFFSRWRRRAALLSLVLALVLIDLFYSGRWGVDSVLTLVLGSNRLMSLNDCLIWTRDPEINSSKQWSIPIPDAESKTGRRAFLKTHEIEWHGQLLGFGFGTFNALSETGISRNAFWSIPNWFIILLPTLLSAGLLLSKPCKSTHMKTSDPIADVRT